MKPLVVIISGVTCSGKTEAAISKALDMDAEIISCDSVQVYRGMDIGSAKASKEDREKVRHHLIDVAEPSEAFDVARYITLAKSALDDISRRGKNVVVAGGSGFYLKSWFSAVTDDVEIPTSVAEKVDDIERKGGYDALLNTLLEIDPESANLVDVKNPRRVKNALRRCMASGKSARELLENFSKLPCPYGDIERRFILLDRSDEDLSKRIRERTGRMLEGEALVRETLSLIKAGIERNPSARSAIGYRETIAWLKSSSPLEELEKEINSNTLSLVKKQRKFFRNSLLEAQRHRVF